MVASLPVDGTYQETGGLRWGRSFILAMNASWPLAKLEATRDAIRIEMSFLGMMRRRFEFARADIRALRRRSGLMSVGLQVEHARSDYPPFIVFWTFRYPTLKARLEQLGYAVLES